jgi:hypothetical protein
MSESADDKITIIEGPPPIFEEIMDGWALGVSETTGRFHLSITTLRTFNGPSLLERCHKAWRNGGMMSLHFKDEIGLVQSVPILAARSLETPDGQVLFLWVRRRSDEIRPLEN